MTRSARSIQALARAAIVGIVVAGCGGGGGDDPGKLREQANAALARWADAVDAAAGAGAVVPVGELTRQVGDWELDVGSNNKPALMAGMVELAADLPPGGPEQRTVTWPDGTTSTVPILTAQKAFEAIRIVPADATCAECTPLRITAARLTDGPIETSRGSATGPLWEFQIDGTAAKIARVAFANAVTVVPPAWDPDHPAVGMWLDFATGSVTGRQLTVTFVGAPIDPGGCGEDYTTEAVESDLAVVVIVYRHPHASDRQLRGCWGNAHRRRRARRSPWRPRRPPGLRRDADRGVAHEVARTGRWVRPSDPEVGPDGTGADCVRATTMTLEQTCPEWMGMELGGRDMRLSWRDLIATLLVAVGAVIYGAWAVGSALPGFGEPIAVAVALFVLGVAASISAVVPGFGELLHGSRLYLAAASIVGVIAFGAGVATFAGADAPAGLAILMLSTLLLWAMSTLRHVGIVRTTRHLGGPIAHAR